MLALLGNETFGIHLDKESTTLEWVVQISTTWKTSQSPNSFRIGLPPKEIFLDPHHKIQIYLR